MVTITHTAMGSPWEVQIFQEIPDHSHFHEDIARILDDFDSIYSRFTSTSLISHLSHSPGTHTVPKELIVMLREYAKMYVATDHKVNPLVGGSIEDLGYDSIYSLVKKDVVREVPSFDASITIQDDTTITIHKPSLIDVGAIGKGYSVGLVGRYLESQNIENFLVNGSGDLLHKGSSSIKVGLENPFNTQEAIGTIQLQNMALASSGSNRRAWGNIHHIIDPKTLTSPQNVVATWVLAENPALADLLATALFLVSPDTLQQHYDFEWLIISSDRVSSYSKGFIADLF